MTEPREVLHYLGADADRGGIVSVVRALATTGRFRCVLGVNRGCVQRREPPLPVFEFAPLAGETLGLKTFWRARGVAAVARAWLRGDNERVFHAHSRAGLAVALWLRLRGERRVVASVHCYGRQKWFYRWAARRLGDRLFWLSPAMLRHYGIASADAWAQCIPGCVPAADFRVSREVTLGRLHLGGAGMLVSWKRWHLVLDALAALPRSERGRVRFTHIGAPDDTDASRRYAQALQTQTKALGLDEVVAWRGEQPDARGLLREIDCLVVASRREPLSVAMLEALQAGVPVLASRSGGNRDVILPSRNGWFFEPDDVRDLMRAMVMLAESDARQRVKIAPADLARFEAPAVAARWAEVYARL